MTRHQSSAVTKIKRKRFDMKLEAENRLSKAK